MLSFSQVCSPSPSGINEQKIRLFVKICMYVCIWPAIKSFRSFAFSYGCWVHKILCSFYVLRNLMNAFITRSFFLVFYLAAGTSSFI